VDSIHVGIVYIVNSIHVGIVCIVDIIHVDMIVYVAGIIAGIVGGIDKVDITCVTVVGIGIVDISTVGMVGISIIIIIILGGRGIDDRIYIYDVYVDVGGVRVVVEIAIRVVISIGTGSIVDGNSHVRIGVIIIIRVSD